MNQAEKLPRHFHLLTDEDLCELREVVQLIRDRRGEVLSNWYQIYLLHFGYQRSLSETGFRRIFEPALLRNQDALLRKDMDGYAASVLLTGKQLAECRVPLDELIATIELFEEAAKSIFPQNPPRSMAVYARFDKLSHIRIILLMGAYMRVESALSAARIHTMELEARNLPAEERTRFHGLVGHTSVMHRLYRRIEAAARIELPLLIVGERGTGKELVARAIHECGTRRDASFAALRCESLPSYLIENELFGYRRLNVNGSSGLYLGFYCTTEHGTLFVREITALPSDVQQRLVRTIHAAPFGDAECVVRIVASIRDDPQRAVGLGQLREDFYRCFQDCVLSVPPLRERLADLNLLIQHFIDSFNDRMVRRSPVTGIDYAAVEAMERYSWPGNVGELHDAIESAFARGRSPIIGLCDLPDEVSGISDRKGPLPTISFETFADAECEVLKRALEMTGGNKVRAAKMLKISRKKLYSGIAKYGIKAIAP